MTSVNLQRRSEPLVAVDGVYKKFCRSLKRSLWYGVKDMACEFAGTHSDRSNLRTDEFWAVHDVSFQLHRGECLGLIGHNGAGKTTLLKMLNGLIRPDLGRIEMRGRVNALIALGAGFNPILTGRENIYVSGSVLGLSQRETQQRIDEIIDFSELGPFIDSPVYTYSSGMAVRLGFAVASSLRPDVLILDEVLAVGDIGFVIKCLNRVRQIMSGAAVILVTHQMQFIAAFCNRVFLMDHGSVALAATESRDAIQRYFELAPHQPHITGHGTVTVTQAELLVDTVTSSLTSASFPQGSNVFLHLDLVIQQDAEPVRLVVSIDDESQTQVISFPLVNTNGEAAAYNPGTHRLRIPFGKLELNTGQYSVLIGGHGVHSGAMLFRSQGNCPFRIIGSDVSWSKFVRPVIPEYRTAVGSSSQLLKP